MSLIPLQKGRISRLFVYCRHASGNQNLEHRSTVHRLSVSSPKYEAVSYGTCRIVTASQVEFCMIASHSPKWQNLGTEMFEITGYEPEWRRDRGKFRLSHNLDIRLRNEPEMTFPSHYVALACHPAPAPSVPTIA